MGPEYGEGAWEFSDSATGVERGRRPASRMVRRPRHRRVMERVRERYISRSERGFSGDNMVEGAGGEPVGLLASGESIVTINFGDMRRGIAWRESHAAVLVAYVPTLSMIARTLGMRW